MSIWRAERCIVEEARECKILCRALVDAYCWYASKRLLEKTVCSRPMMAGMYPRTSLNKLKILDPEKALEKKMARDKSVVSVRLDISMLNRSNILFMVRFLRSTIPVLL